MFVNKKVLGIEMNARRNRRLLVAVILILIAALFLLVLLGRLSGIAMVLTIMVLTNPLIFGGFLFWGKKRGGLLKPFASFESRNDERELAARDFAHFRAYWWLEGSLIVVAYLPYVFPSHFGDNIPPVRVLFLTRSLVWGAVALSLTLPQLILLWTEPDIDVE